MNKQWGKSDLPINRMPTKLINRLERKKVFTVKDFRKFYDDFINTNNRCLKSCYELLRFLDDNSSHYPIQKNSILNKRK